MPHQFFNIFGRLNFSPNNDREKLSAVTSWLCHLVTSFFPVHKHTLIFDMHELKLRHVPFANSLAHFFQANPCQFHLGEKFVSFHLQHARPCAEFVKEFDISEHNKYIRVLKENQGVEKEISTHLEMAPGESETDYMRQIEEYLAIVVFQPAAPYLGILSAVIDLAQFERTLLTEADEVQLSFERSMTESR